MAPVYEPKAKRRKLDQPEADQVYTIGSVRDLHDLLRFKQSSSPEVKNGKLTMKHLCLPADILRHSTVQGLPCRHRQNRR